MSAKVWQYLGAMMTENKGGVMAVSFTRVLGVVLFVICGVLWITKATDLTAMGPPDSAVHTLWSLIGIKGLKDGMKALKGKSSYED